MFHWTNNIFFGRKADGSVRVIQFKTLPAGDWPQADYEPQTKEAADNILADWTIDDSSWASIVASVSAGNEGSGRFYAAKAFHASTGPVEVVAQ